MPDDPETFAVMALVTGGGWSMRGEKLPFGNAVPYAEWLMEEPSFEETRVISEQKGQVRHTVRRGSLGLMIEHVCMTCKKPMNRMTSRHVQGTIVYHCESCFQDHLRARLEDVLHDRGADRHERNSGTPPDLWSDLPFTVPAYAALLDLQVPDPGPNGGDPGRTGGGRL